jgi:hypothetical protein
MSDWDEVITMNIIQTITSGDEEEFKKLHVKTDVPGYVEIPSLMNITNEENSIPRSEEYSEPLYEESTISAVEGVILNVEENTVRVKLGSSTYANLPKVLFDDDPSFAKEGQKIRYILKKDIEGYRYQEIIPIIESSSSSAKKPILDILDKIKYRDE